MDVTEEIGRVLKAHWARYRALIASEVNGPKVAELSGREVFPEHIALAEELYDAFAEAGVTREDRDAYAKRIEDVSCKVYGTPEEMRAAAKMRKPELRAQ